MASRKIEPCTKLETLTSIEVPTIMRRFEKNANMKKARICIHDHSRLGRVRELENERERRRAGEYKENGGLRNFLYWRESNVL